VPFHPAVASGVIRPRPRVVLGMTLYNRAPHLREALDSLLGQTYTDFALLLLDDASSDETEAIAREYEATDGGCGTSGMRSGRR
jgi:glycosyltransferase involved in cell wall biosynthesis